MGKHLWRKHSTIRVKKDGPGCIWTVFRLLNYHPWQNVKRLLMLPYINQKSRKKRAKMINEQIEFSKIAELEEDTVTNYSVNASPSGTESSSRKMSIKARIKALLANNVSKRGKVNSVQEHELLALKNVCTDLSAPTLISFLKASNLTAINPVEESANLSRAETVKHSELMEEYVGVFELFKVDQDAFLKLLQDNPRKKHKLVKSGSFPFSNDPSRNSVTFSKTPLKLENKVNEVWPIPNQQGYELRKSRSQNFGRSSSLKEIFDKNLSKSLKLIIEKEHCPIIEDETENLEHCSIIEDSVTTDQSTFEHNEDVQSRDEIDSNESLQYVKFVLEIIGFTLDEPLDPALFEDVEIFYSVEPKQSSKEEIIMSASERRILFDLLNEALLEIHESSCAYYPNPLMSSSTSCIVHPVRKVENRVVEQVWEFINEYLLWQPETYEDIDGVIVQELFRRKCGWSNLQRDTEVLAADLEDWILDDLLGEFVCCQVIV